VLLKQAILFRKVKLIEKGAPFGSSLSFSKTLDLAAKAKAFHGQITLAYFLQSVNDDDEKRKFCNIDTWVQMLQNFLRL
jgi:hypothetical protein